MEIYNEKDEHRKTLKISRLSKTGISIILCALLTFGILFSDFSLLVGDGNNSFGVVKTYAKNVGEKNEQALKQCQMVVKGEATKDSEGNAYEKLLDGAVYRGGNSHSGVEGVYIDNDLNDFANPLPYGNVFVDTTRLSWSTPKI